MAGADAPDFTAPTPSTQPDLVALDAEAELERDVPFAGTSGHAGNALAFPRDMPVMSRGSWIALVVVVVGAATALTLFFARSVPPQASSPSGTSVSAPAAPKLSDQQAAFLVAELTSGDEKRVRAVVVVADEQQIEPAAVAQFVTLGRLAFDVSSFQDNGDGTARVTALRDGSPTWTVDLVLVDDAWKISGTETL